MKAAYIKKTPPSERKTRTVREAAARLGVSPNHLYSMIRQNQFPHIKIGERVVVPDSVLDRLLEVK
jgi:excisionase family DNA binding protein